MSAEKTDIETARLLYGKAIKEARLNRGLLLREVALKVGINPKNIGTLSHIESGRRWPGRALARKLAELLGVEAPKIPRGKRYTSAERRQFIGKRAVDKRNSV